MLAPQRTNLTILRLNRGLISDNGSAPFFAHILPGQHAHYLPLIGLGKNFVPGEINEITS